MTRRRIQRVLQGRERPAQAPLQAPDLPKTAVEQGDDRSALERQTYLTTREAVVYLRFPSLDALYQFLSREQIPRCRRGRTVLLRRRDLDHAVQPVGERHGRRA